MGELYIRAADCEPSGEIDWYKPQDTKKLVFHISKFIIKLHQKGILELEKLPANIFSLYEAFDNNKIDNEDVIFTKEGIYSIKGVFINEKGLLQKAN